MQQLSNNCTCTECGHIIKQQQRIAMMQPEDDILKQIQQISPPAAAPKAALEDLSHGIHEFLCHFGGGELNGAETGT